jgi:hypothetical protein
MNTPTRVQICVGFVLAGLMALGCSRAVNIPSDQVDDLRWHQPGTYRIRLHGREEYLVRRYTVTDSTVVVEELHPSDERYRFHRTEVPITIPLSRVESIARLETNRPVTALLLVTAGAAAAFVVWLANVLDGLN